MESTFTGQVPYTAGECIVWGDGGILGRSPIEQNSFEVVLTNAPERVTVEHRVHGDVRRARIVTVTGLETHVPTMTPGTTLRAIAWREAWEHGLGDRQYLVDALLPDPVGDAVRRMPELLRAQARSQLLKALRIAMYVQRFPWSWDDLDAELQEHLSTPVRTLLVVGVWRSALRVSDVDRQLIELSEGPAERLELRACRLAAGLLTAPLAEAGVKLPDPSDRPLSTWSIAVLFSLRVRDRGDPLTAGSLCTEVAVAIDRALDGIVSSAIERDDPEILQSTLSQQLVALESSLRREVAPGVSELVGGWNAVAALWISSLVGLGYNEDIDRSTESYTVPST